MGTEKNAIQQGLTKGDTRRWRCSDTDEDDSMQVPWKGDSGPLMIATVHFGTEAVSFSEYERRRRWFAHYVSQLCLGIVELLL